MCAAQHSTIPTVITKVNTSVSTSSTPKQGSKPVPKWLKMKQQNTSSAGKTAKPTVQKSSSSAQKPHAETRNAKRARWAKKAKPVAKSSVQRVPVKEYISACCSLPAVKPRAGTKEVAKDPESGKMKDKSKGLGHWRCSGCRKIAKVRPQSPAPKVVATGTVVGIDPSRGSEVTVATT
jgi:hypothetical protein